MSEKCIRLTTVNQIPSNVSLNEKVKIMKDRMRQCASVRDYHEAEYWRLQIIKAKKNNKAERKVKLNNFYENESKALQARFDRKCRKVVDFHENEMKKLDEESLRTIVDAKLKHEDQRRALDCALEHAYVSLHKQSHVSIRMGVDKKILDLNKREHLLSQSNKFMAAHEVRGEQEAYMKMKGVDWVDEACAMDVRFRQKLEAHQEKSMDLLLDKLAFKKIPLHNKLQNELQKLDIWKKQRDERLRSQRCKDLLRLNGKLCAKSNRSHQDRIDFAMGDNKNAFSKKPNVPKPRVLRVTNALPTFKPPNEEKKIYISRSHHDNQQETKPRSLTSGSFIQYIDGKHESYPILIEVDERNKEIRWKRKEKMDNEFALPFDDIFDAQAPSEDRFFNESNRAKYGFDGRKCMTVFAKSIKLHLEAKSVEIMERFQNNLMDSILRQELALKRNRNNFAMEELKPLNGTIIYDEEWSASANNEMSRILREFEEWKQQRDGGDECYVASVEIDNTKKEIRWKRQEEALAMEQDQENQAKHGFDGKKCFTLHQPSNSAKSTDFAAKIDAILAR